MTVPLYQLSDTWGDPSQRFSAIMMNVQDGGHALGSLLFDLQVNGISQFSVDPTGAVVLLSTMKFFKDTAGPLGSSLALRNGGIPQSLRIYNTYTDDNNYERGGSGWLVSANTFAIGTMALGSGTLRPVQFLGSNFLISGALATNVDLGIFRVAPGVLGINNGSPGVQQGCYLKWGGTARMPSDVSLASSATLANIAGLTVNVAAGRAYSFEAELSVTGANAGGVQFAIGGTATATNIIYDGWIVDAGNAGTKGNAQATALNGVVASAIPTGSAVHVTICGTIEVNAAGTLTVRGAQNTVNATAVTFKRGSRLIVHDVT